MGHHLNYLIARAEAADPNACVIWPYSKMGARRSYGKVCVEGKYRGTHVVACEMMHGPKPTDKDHAAHACGNGLCFNPHHLYWATVRENSDDIIRHGIQKGERNPGAKLSLAQVVEIRQRYARGGITQDQLAAEYGVCQAAISFVWRGANWAHVA